MVQVHVTRVSGGGVYGHTTEHCDESGCNGSEKYWPELDHTGAARGSVVDVADIDDLSAAVTDADLEELATEAAEHCDDEQVRLCKAALRGDTGAFRACAKVIMDARAQEQVTP